MKKQFISFIFLAFTPLLNAFFITNPAATASARFSLDAQDALNITVENTIFKGKQYYLFYPLRTLWNLLKCFHQLNQLSLRE